jgi:hypothetical protein
MVTKSKYFINTMILFVDLEKRIQSKGRQIDGIGLKRCACRWIGEGRERSEAARSRGRRAQAGSAGRAAEWMRLR